MRAMKVRHTIEDVKGVPHHIVRIYPPASPYDHKIGRWPVTEKATSLEAIWSGVFEAWDCCDFFAADKVAVHSTDKEAFEAYCAEVDSYEQRK